VPGRVDGLLATLGGVEGRVDGLLIDGGFAGLVEGRETVLPPPPDGRCAGLDAGREACPPPPDGRDEGLLGAGRAAGRLALPPDGRLTEALFDPHQSTGRIFVHKAPSLKQAGDGADPHALICQPVRFLPLGELLP